MIVCMLQTFIEEREQTLVMAREQFISERQEQGRQLEQIVHAVREYRDLQQHLDAVCSQKCEHAGKKLEVENKVMLCDMF